MGEMSESISRDYLERNLWYTFYHGQLHNLGD